MTSISGDELVRTRDCKEPGCTQEATNAFGIYARLCRQHADEKRKQRAAVPPPVAGRAEQQLRELLNLAKEADRLEAKQAAAAKTFAAARTAAMTARERYATAVKEALRDD